MRLFKRLWQKVFVYSLVLVLGAGAMGVFLVRDNLKNRASNVVFTFTSELRKALTGQNSLEANAFLRRFNNQEAKFWIEDSQGNLIAGQRFADRAGKDWAPHLRMAERSDDVTLWQTDLEQPFFLVTAPCLLEEGEATLYAAYMSFPVPPLDTLLSPGIITLILITGFLALWMAFKVGRPLRQLRSEVSEISGAPPQLRNVTVAGYDEIADVARAVNLLVDSLRSHMDNMNQLVLNISHELRSPITRMGLSAEMIGAGLTLLNNQEKNAGQRESETIRLANANFAALLQELEHMDKLIGDTLFSSKLEMRDSSELAETVSLSALCDNSAESYSAIFRQAGIRFMSSIEKGVMVRGDSTLLTLVLSNLLDNAIKYAGTSEPSARLRLYREGAGAILSIENTCAAPLPDDALEHLFDLYFRYNQHAGTGVGLGLAIVRRITALHGGRSEAFNTENGLLIRLTLPVL